MKRLFDAYIYKYKYSLFIFIFSHLRHKFSCICPGLLGQLVGDMWWWTRMSSSPVYKGKKKKSVFKSNFHVLYATKQGYATCLHENKGSQTQCIKNMISGETWVWNVDLDGKGVLSIVQTRQNKSGSSVDQQKDISYGWVLPLMSCSQAPKAPRPRGW